jgi:hypothetical protein
MINLTAAGVVALAGQASVLGQNQQPAPYNKPVPVRPNLPGTLTEEVGLRTSPPLTREGTFVSSARGQAVKGKSGRWFFVFDPDSAGRTLPPMVLLPNLNLAALERLAERSPEGTRLAITGQVTVYQGLNYLLATAPPLVLRAEDAAPAAPAPSPARTPGSTPDAGKTAPGSAAPLPPPTSEPAAPAARSPAPGGPTAKASDEPSVEEIVAKLDKSASKVAATSPQRASTVVSSSRDSTQTEPADSGPARALIAPGVIASRRGRIARAADGAMVFMFDSGTDGGAPAPLVLLPCQNLANIEQIGERSGEGATYTVSGEVMTYRGHNYLLVRSFQANRTGDQIVPAQ